MRTLSSGLMGTPSLVQETSGIGLPINGAEITRACPSSTDRARSGEIKAGRDSGSPAMPFSGKPRRQYYLLVVQMKIDGLELNLRILGI